MRVCGCGESRSSLSIYLPTSGLMPTNSARPPTLKMDDDDDDDDDDDEAIGGLGP